jgi:cytochrome c biogenesis protein CcdA/thiol-disulfide isomerase/thioredoxin
MLLLLLFALIAGAGTAITPCVLPVLPALLSASAIGGRRRPLGIVLGLAVTFTITIVALAKLVNGVGLGSSATRILAIVVLISFGVVMLVPALAQRVQAPLSRLARFGPKTRGDGFWTGLGVGGALGFVCAPCAGPILGAVIGVSATTGPTVRVVLIALAYSAGLSTVLLIYGLGGRKVLARIKRSARGHVVERTLAMVLIATGVAMAFNLDTSFDDLFGKNAATLPAFLTDPTQALENSNAVENRLAALRPPSRFVTRQEAAAKKAKANPAVAASLPKLGAAPNFTNTQDWFNTPGDRPLSITKLRGKVVIVDFWTYTCINCIRTLPFVKGLYAHYHRYGLDIVGVETPEFTFEQEASNVRAAIKSDGISYPVVQDNRYGTWDAYQNEYWPAEYYIDANGEVRHTQFGEGDYEKDETIVRELLTAAGARHLPARMTAHALTPSTDLGTQETYLNPQRESGFVEPFASGTNNYVAPKTLPLDQWALKGSWTVGSQSITPGPSASQVSTSDGSGSVPASSGSGSHVSSISGSVQARDVYLVMTSGDGTAREGRVLINGEPPTAAERGTDVRAGGYFTVVGERLYNLVKLKQDGQFAITVQISKGINAYDFTFG